jgi:hypothetical protein
MIIKIIIIITKIIIKEASQDYTKFLLILQYESQKID